MEGKEVWLRQVHPAGRVLGGAYYLDEDGTRRVLVPDGGRLGVIWWFRNETGEDLTDVYVEVSGAAIVQEHKLPPLGAGATTRAVFVADFVRRETGRLGMFSMAVKSAGAYTGSLPHRVVKTLRGAPVMVAAQPKEPITSVNPVKVRRSLTRP